ncbi:MAG TPA: alpha/beta hydrolase [Jiangellales bacterium]|nr:alpha/beta hydrolase [Jiangellales bacterium]
MAAPAVPRTPGGPARRSGPGAVVLAALLAVLSAVLVAPPAEARLAEPLAVTTVAVTVEVDGRSFRARVSYPLTGRDHPGVAFGHGYLQGPERYVDLLERVAAQGFVVIAPASETGFWPRHSRLAEDLTRSLTWLVEQSRTSGSPLAGKVAERSLALAGHSMGGGAAVIAAARDPRVRAVATLSAAETVPPASRAAAGLRIPSLWVTGSEDSVVSPATTRALRAATPGPALYAEVEGGWHCGFAGSSAYWGLGCDSGDLPREQQQATTADLLVRWLAASLLGEPLDVTAVPGVSFEPGRG